MGVKKSNVSKRIKAEESKLKKLLDLIDSIDRMKGNPLNKIDQIRAAVDKIEKILKETSFDEVLKGEVNQYIEQVRSNIPKWEEQLKKNFGHELESELKKAGFELRGHYPLLKVSFYNLEVDLENFKVVIWYGPQQEKLDTCKLLPESIVKRIVILTDKIAGRSFNDTEFLSKLYEAYKISVHRQNKKIGHQIPISQILFEYAFLIQDKKFRTDPIRSNYKEYGRVFFSYDLYLMFIHELGH